MDFLIDTDTRQVYLGEINPRVSGASPLTNLITSTYGGCPIYFFHMLEFMDVEWELDLAQIQKRWAEFDNWSQPILKYPIDNVEMITKAPASGIWQMDDRGDIKLVRKSIDWFLVSGEQEAFSSACTRQATIATKGLTSAFWFRAAACKTTTVR